MPGAALPSAAGGIASADFAVPAVREPVVPAPRPRRWWIAVLAVVLAAALVAGTWVAASRFQSPAQREAAAQPPPAQPVVVDATRGDLVNRTTMMATAALDNPRTVPLPATQGTAVVTAAGATAGGSLASGSVVTWVNGRPVLALRGPFPLYRDIGPGDEGDDVRLLQQALADLGYGIDPDGQFGAYTAQCVDDLYQSVGSTAPTRQVAATATGRASSDAPAAAGASSTAPSAAPSAAAPGTDPAGSSSGSGTAAGSAGTAGSPSSTTPKTETYVSAAEILVLPALPARVAAVPAVGTVLSADTATIGLSDSGIGLSGKVPGDVAYKLAVGATGTAQVGDRTIPVRVSEIREPSAASAADGQGDAASQGDPSQSTVVFAHVEGDLPADWVGNTQILVTLDLTAPIADAVLVPQRAIANDATGANSALVRQPDGSFVQTPVQVQGCVGGMCALAGDDLDGATVRVDG